MFSRRRLIAGIGSIFTGSITGSQPAPSSSAPYGGPSRRRLQRFDWRDEGASGGATAAQNREALVRTVAKAAAVDNGVVVLGYDPDPFDLDLWEPATGGVIIDGAGSTIRQVVPETVASRRIGSEYRTLAAFAIGPRGANLKFDNLAITQDEAGLTALSGHASTHYMGPVCVRRADGVEFHNTTITAALGPAFIWRGGDDGVFHGELNACRGVVHTGFRNDPFAGDSGSADVSVKYTPRRFRGDIRFVGSPVDKRVQQHFHMTGGNDWDLALDFVDLSDPSFNVVRIYCNDYGLYLADGVTRDSSMRGRIRRLTVNGGAKTACIVEGKSAETSLDAVLYDCEIHFSAPARITVTGDGTSATGQGIHLKNATGVTGEAFVESTSSPLLVSGASDRRLTGEYRCTKGGLGNMTLYTGAGAVLGQVVLPRLVASGPDDEHLERFGLAAQGPLSYVTEAATSRLEANSVVRAARLIETAGMRGPTVLGDIAIDIRASGLHDSYALAFNSGSHAVTLGSVRIFSSNRNRSKTRGVTVNSASDFTADLRGLPLVLSHSGVSRVSGHILSELPGCDAFEVENEGVHEIDARLESSTRRRVAVLRGGVTRFSPNVLIIGRSLTTAAPLHMTGGVAEFNASNGAFDYTGSGPPISFDDGGMVRGDLGSHANLHSTGTLWSNSNRIAARSTAVGTRFVNSSDHAWNLSNGADWYRGPAP